MATSPIFTEVIDVSLNSGPLEESLSNLIEMYQSKLQDLSSAGLDVGSIGGLNVAAINDDLTSVREELKSLTSAFLDSFGQIAAASADSGTTTASNITTKLAEVDEASDKSTKKQLEDLSQIARGSEEAWDTFAQAAQNALSGGFDPRVRMTADLTANLFRLIAEGGSEAFEKLTAQQQDWFLKYQKNLSVIQEANTIAAEEGSSVWQREQMKQVAAQEAATNAMLADYKRRESASNFIDAGSEKYQREQMRMVAMQEQATREMEADLAKRKTAEEDASSVPSAPSTTSGSIIAKGGSSFLGDFSTQFANLAKLQLEWDAIRVIIDAAKDSVEAFFSFFKEGVSYLQDIETRSAEIQGVLASNVTFSEDQAENFKLAGTAAAQINKEIQDYAIKYGVSIDVLTRGFKSFVDAGGVALTHGVDEALETSVLLTTAIKASGKDAQTTRTALSEIPKLLDGTITSSSKILETLGISVSQWKAMNAEAQSHHDLLQQLQPILSNYLNVAGDAANRFGAIKESIGLIYDRTAALGAQEFWPALKDDLKAIRDFLIENKTQIDACAVALGDMAKGLLDVSDKQDVLNGLLSAFQFFVVSLIHVKYAIQDVVGGLQEIYYAGKLVNDFNLSKLEDGTAQYAGQIKDDLQSIKDIWEDGKNSQSDMEADIDKVYNPLPSAPGAPTPDGKGKHGPPDNSKANKDAITELEAQYKTFVETVKTASDSEKEKIQENLAARKISIQEAASETKKANDDELSQLKAIIDTYKALAEVTKAPARSKSRFIGTLGTQDQQLTDQSSKSDTASRLAAVKDSEAAQDQSLAQQEAAIKKSYSERLATIQAGVKAGVLTQSQGAAQELVIINSAHAAEEKVLQAEVVQAGQIANLRQAALARLAAADAAYTQAVVANAAKRGTANLSDLESSDTNLSKQRTDSYNIAVAETEATKRLSQTQIEAAVIVLNLAKAKLGMATVDLAAIQNELAVAKANGETGKTLDALVEKYNAAAAAKAKAGAGVDKAEKAVVETDPVVPALQESFSQWKDLFNSFTNGTHDFGVQLSDTLNSTTTALVEAGKIAAGLQEAIKQGGAQGVAYGLGAAGNAASSVSASVGDAVKSGGSLVAGLSSSMKSLFSNAGVIGSLASAAAGLITIITAFFTAAAKEIADNIKKEFSNTMQAYQDQSTTLGQTIQAVQAEEAEAISKLSGMKGGQAQLDTLLPQLQSQLASLEQQQTTIINNFSISLEKLQLGNSALGQALDSWQSINKEVQDYVNAGGDAATAAQYLSLSLQQMQQNAAIALQQGDQQAIQTAINYNNLLIQRQQLTDAYNKSRFDTLNADALERRASSAVSVGLNQQAADETYQTQLQNINSQVELAASQVSMYQQIYKISADTASLQQQSNQLNLDMLKQQLQTLQAQAEIYSSIYQNPNGTYGTNQFSYSGSGPAPGTSTTTIGQIVVNVDGSDGIDGVTLANTIQQQLQTNGRYGLGTTFSQN